MDLGLEGRIVLICGSSKGIGYGCARVMAREGARIIMVSRNRTNLKKAAGRLGEESGADIFTIAADLGTAQGTKTVIEKIINKYKGLDVLINNTGGPPPGGFMDKDEGAFEEAHQNILMSAVRLCYGFLPCMIRRGRGRIINITSVTVKEPSTALVLSDVYRAGVISLAKTLSMEVGKYKITVNNLCPGSVETERARLLRKHQASASGQSVQEIKKKALSEIPLGRLQPPEDFGNIAAFLASDLAGNITGVTLQVDGGKTSCIM